MPAPTPTPYARSYDFSDHEAASPAAPAAGSQHDAEYDAIAAKITATLAALADVRRSDGSLVNYSVTLDSLSPTVRVMMGGWVPRGAWVTATAYAVNDLVRDGSADDYVCVTAHTSGVFATDEAAGKWMRVAVLSSGGYASAADVAAAQAAAIASSAASLAAHVALVNPHATTAASVGALPTTGGTMTGDIVLAGAPTLGLHPATKAYADDMVAGYAPLAGATFSGNVLAPRVNYTDSSFYSQVSGTAAYHVFAANNFIAYDRSFEWFVLYTNGVVRLVLDKTGRVMTGGVSTPATGYTAAGDISLPTGGVVSAKNTPKAWVTFNGTGTPAVVSGFNVSGITDNGAGDYTIAFTNAMADANYCVLITARKGVSGMLVGQVYGTTTTDVRITFTSNAGALADPAMAHVVIFG